MTPETRPPTRREADPEDRLMLLLNEPKDSSAIHYDEDTIPHGACSDPIHCDCMCPECWQLKADIIRKVREALRAIVDDAVGERRDPLWIVQRDLIMAGRRALSAEDQP